MTFECLEVQGSWKWEALEPKLVSKDESPSAKDWDTKMPALSSNSGTTISTSIKFGNLDAINSHKEMLPIFKSYNPVFISRKSSSQKGEP